MLTDFYRATLFYSALYDTALCPSVCPSVCHKSIL